MPDDTPNPKGVLHWVSSPAPGVAPASAEVRLYDRLLTSFDPAELQGAADWLVFLNPESEVIVPGALVEPSVATAGRGARFQFERVGFFAADADSSDSRLVFNRTVTLKEAKDRKAIKK
jgi:glutaminyl-tRNA synthetase